jgi:D-serine deaminase-like pyridoxal phosphate-dependent protein
MAGLGVCAIDDIAVSVLSEVIGYRRASGEVLIDAGWMALSRDRGTADQRVDYGYGLVRDEAGDALGPEVMVRATNQEHGILARRDGEPLDPADFPIGRRLRILPNHACATAGQFERMWWIGSGGGSAERLDRCRGW